ncbi:MAG: NFACT RNA binding domain-containing protein [Candidatus Thorarchaeota archaeon]|nr:NFACT RNA binding domain-containing protein [Candidatus Thorarchaeota archaeon]
MKDTMSNIDIRMILPEIKETAQGAFIKNVYQYGPVFVLKIYKPGGGTTQLLIEPGRRIHLTEYRRAAPRNPPKFISVLRKYLREKKIVKIKQHDLDRIITLEIEDGDDRYKVVTELFGAGNILLLDTEDRIFVAQRYKKMRDRDIVPKAIYQFPPPRGVDIFDIDADKLPEIIADSHSNVVRTLASRLNLDALSCEEICALAEVAPTAKVSELDSSSFVDLVEGVRKFSTRLQGGVEKPRIVFEEESEDEEPDNLAFVPFDFEMFKDYPAQIYETFSQTIDEYYGVSEAELEPDEKEDLLAKERRKLLRIIEKQQEGISSLERKAEESRIIGETIYANFQIVQEVLQTITQARTSGLSWDEIISRIEEGKKSGNTTAQIIKKIIPSQAQIVVDLRGVEVRLDIRLSAQDNGSRLYELAKKAEKKVKGAMKQIEKTKAKLEKLDSVEIKQTITRPVKRRKRKWFEKFRWFRSSEGFLILGGRDAKTNEQLAKRHLGPNDIFLHAALHGAPYTVIKVPEEPPGEQTIKEAAQFAVTYSRAWQDGLSAGDAYWVNPEQVSFTPPSGEYLPTGAVMIYGTKNYVKSVPVELAVGIIIEEGETMPMAGPPSAISAHTDYLVQVAPGNIKKGKLVKEIITALVRKAPETVRPNILEIPQEDMMRVLPSGDGKIISHE